MTDQNDRPAEDEMNLGASGHAFQRMVSGGFLAEAGLLWKINHDLLHPLGLMLMAFSLDETGGPSELMLAAAAGGTFAFADEVDTQRRAQWEDFVDNAPALRAELLANQKPDGEQAPDEIALLAVPTPDGWWFASPGELKQRPPGAVDVKVPYPLVYRWQAATTLARKLRDQVLVAAGLEPELDHDDGSGGGHGG